MKKKSLLLRLLFIAGIVIIFFVSKNYNCLKLDSLTTPQVLSQNTGIKSCYILYGTGLCNSCGSGKRLLSLKKDQSDILFVVPRDFDDVAIHNLKETFSLSGTVVRGFDEVENLLRNIALCQKYAEWQKNIYIELDKDGDMSKIKKF